MGVIKKIFLLITLFVSVYLAIVLHQIIAPSPPPLPALDDSFWWGPGDAKKVDTSIRPFKIEVPSEVIGDLNERLDGYLKKPSTPPFENEGFRYGFNSDYLKTIITYWRNEYQWKDRETLLNRYPQYKTNIQGLDIHFIWVKPENAAGKKVLPLLLLHGWPGSIKEFYGIIPFLTIPRKDTDFVFQVIAPSLPGFGFSDATAKPDFSFPQVAVVMNNLMKRIGFDKYYVQGGDWGSVISKNMGQLYPSSILGAHSNLCFVLTPKSFLKLFLGSFYPDWIEEKNLQHLIYPIWPNLKFILEESGYFHLQATKPDTIGSALMDSPAGLAAYILEKFSIGTNPEWRSLSDGGLIKKFKLDDLLDNVMIYWVSNSIQTSVRYYSEHLLLAQFRLRLDEIPITVPTACARFHKEMFFLPEHVLKDSYINLLHLSDYAGGHFAAMEIPEVLSEDIWTAVKKFRNFHYIETLNY